MNILKYYFLFFISTIFINNCVIFNLIGICPFIGISKKIQLTMYIGILTTFVITITTSIIWIINKLIILPFEIFYLRTFIYILITATIVQITDIIIKNINPIFYKLLGIFLPLITTNCILLGIPLISINNNYNFYQSILYSFSSSISFLLTIVTFSAIRERIELSNVPYYFKGSPIILITAGLISLSFMGFVGIVKI